MNPRRWRVLAAAGAGILLLAILVLATTLLPPQRLARLVLGAVGDGVGLEIGFEGAARYRLRGTPMLEVEGVSIRRPGEAEPLLRARRAMVSLPWTTLRGRGAAPLVIERIELDAAVLDVPRLVAWLGSRPPGEGALPTLRDGLRIRDAHVVGDGWNVVALDLHLPRFAPDAPVAGSADGVVLLAPPTRLRFDLQFAATHPGPGAGLAVRGPVRLEHEDWALPAFVAASAAPNRLGEDWHVPRFRFAAAGAYHGQGEPLRFALGVQGPLRLRAGTWTLAPAGFALRGDRDAVPELSGRGDAVLGRTLSVRLQGRMPEWPRGWPTLPPPLDAAQPTDVVATYHGPVDPTGAPIDLELVRGDARAAATARLPAVLAWLDGAATGTPLPPVRAVARVPRVEVAGAVVEGLEIELDPGVEDPR